jgi:hypothetical protein
MTGLVFCESRKPRRHNANIKSEEREEREVAALRGKSPPFAKGAKDGAPSRSGEKET